MFLLTHTQALKQYEEHLSRASVERAAYRDVCKRSREILEKLLHPNPTSSAVPHPLLPPAEAHYSFDFAQQVHYPSNPFQPGPLYFLAPRQCAIFGICCEAIPRQVSDLSAIQLSIANRNVSFMKVNYLIDESLVSEKGANTVISLLHHFFAIHSLGESTVYLNADNCAGQNKNNALVQVCMCVGVDVFYIPLWEFT